MTVLDGLSCTLIYMSMICNLSPSVGLMVQLLESGVRSCYFCQVNLTTYMGEIHAQRFPYQALTCLLIFRTIFWGHSLQQSYYCPRHGPRAFCCIMSWIKCSDNLEMFVFVLGTFHNRSSSCSIHSANFVTMLWCLGNSIYPKLVVIKFL